MSTAAMTREIRPEHETLGPLEVRASYRGQLIGTRLLSIDPKARQSQVCYRIGAAPNTDAPAPMEAIGGLDLPLVTSFGQDFLVNVSPTMTGQLSSHGKVIYLADYLRDRGGSFALPVDASARIDCGPMTFTLARTAPAEAVPRRRFVFDLAKNRYLLGTIVGMGLFLAMIFTVPPETRSLSYETPTISASMKDFLRMAKETPAVETPAKTTGESGTAGKAHQGESGQTGDKKSKDRDKSIAIAGNAPVPRIGKAEAIAQAKNHGILGILNSMDSKIGSIFNEGSSIGSDPQTLLGNLSNGPIGSAYGIGGLGMTGSGAGGGGTGVGTLGTWSYGTVGPGSGYGVPGNVALRAKTKAVIPTVRGDLVSVKGSLDKEIIRRIVRLHMNEIRFCYDKELTTHPGLEGRISVQFLIAPTGLVINSYIASTTMNNVHVESCVASAIKRFEFPRPDGGGVAMVAYPFNFTSVH